MGDMDDIVKEFLVESNENLDQLDRDLVILEQYCPVKTRTDSAACRDSGFRFHRQS